MNKQILAITLITTLTFLLLIAPSPLPPTMGKIDFRAYWSAAYLLARGENFADPAQLFRVEKEQTAWWEDHPMMTWNPPWLLAVLLPYTLVPFDRAAWLWMLTNIALVFASAVLLWQLKATPPSPWQGEGRGGLSRYLIWIAPLVAFAYSPTLIALIAGQVNVLVLCGLALFLFFDSQKRDELTGAALALTLVKPQLVYVTAPILLLDLVRQRRWRALLGLAVALLSLSAVVFFLRPTFPFEYAVTVAGGRLFDYDTPTLGGALGAAINWQWGRLIALVVLPLAILIWSRRARWEARTLVDVTLLISVITAPFAWSYDFVVLLVPLLRIVGWMVAQRFAPLETCALALVLVSADALSFYQRVLTPSELYFFWIPLLIAGVYAYGASQVMMGSGGNLSKRQGTKSSLGGDVAQDA